MALAEDPLETMAATQSVFLSMRCRNALTESFSFACPGIFGRGCTPMRDTTMDGIQT